MVPLSWDIKTRPKLIKHSLAWYHRLACKVNSVTFCSWWCDHLSAQEWPLLVPRWWASRFQVSGSVPQCGPSSPRHTCHHAASSTPKKQGRSPAADRPQLRPPASLASHSPGSGRDSAEQPTVLGFGALFGHPNEGLFGWNFYWKEILGEVFSRPSFVIFFNLWNFWKIIMTPHT